MKSRACLALALLVTSILALTTLCPALSASDERVKVKWLSIAFEKPRVLRAPVKGYVLVEVPGTKPYMVPGAPIVPVKVLILKLPYGCVVRSVKVDVETVRIPGKYVLLPTPQPEPLQPPRNATAYVEDPEIYQSKKPYPEHHVVYEVKRGIDPLTLARVTYVVIRVFPVQFVPAEKALLYTRRVDISVEYEAPQASSRPLQPVDIVVITSQALEPAAVTLAQWKNATGFTAKVYTVEWITANYPGSDDPEKIRNFINYMVNNYNTTWVIILGDADVVPVRKAYIPGLGDRDFIETDLYYADLDGTWDTDGDGYYGEVEDNIDGYPDVIVGRLPASSLSEADAIVNKLMNYAPRNEWFRRALFLGTVTFGDELAPEGEILKDYIETNCLPANFSWTKLYEGLGNLTPTTVSEEMNKGYGIVNFAGHGNVNVWSFGEGGCFTNTDVFSLTNGFNASLVVAMSCLTGDFADTDVCIGEAFLIHGSGGGIAYIGAADVAYGYLGYWITNGLAGEIDWRVFASFKAIEDSGGTPTPGCVHTMVIEEYLSSHGRSDEYDWYTVVEYGTLLGDPTLPLTGTGDPPPPPPTPKLYGYVMNEQGSIVPNATVRLYDYSTGTLLYEYNTTNGYYEFVDIPYGTYTMEVYAEGYNTFREDFYYPRVVLEKNVTLFGPPQFQPNTVLIVVDDDGSGYIDEGVWPGEIRDVVVSLGFNVYVWNESVRGRPSLEVLLNENVTAVVWHVGTYYNYAVDSTDAQTLIQFVESGGRLLLEGEDIGYEHKDDEFMLKVAHAKYLVDNANASGIEATARHPVVYNLTQAPFDIVPPYPDGVEPASNGTEVARYSGTSYSAVIVYDGLYWGSGGRVVYVAFPLHYLTAGARSTLIENAVRWITTSYVLRASTDKQTYVLGSTVKIVASLLNGSEPLTSASVKAMVYYPNGTLAAELQMTDDGSGGDDAAGDGNYTALYTLPTAAPTGRYRVEVNASIPGYVPLYEETTFEAVAQGTPSFTITVEDVMVVEGRILLNITVSNNASLVITMVQYDVDWGGPVNVTEPVDGAYDGDTETVHIEIANASSYSLGEHEIHVKVYAEQGHESGWVTYKFIVRELQARYNLVSLILKPLRRLKASDIARAVGPSLKAVWRWRVDKQEFEGYVPGVSSPEEDFPIEPGYGYFVYLDSPARLVEVGL